MHKIFRTGLVWIWVAILLLLIDRVDKIGANLYLLPYEPLQLLPIFNLTLAYNTGAAFSFLHSASGWQNIFLGSIAILVSLFIGCWLWRLPSKAWWRNVALNFILGGALGNAWDRMLYGQVIDFFDFHLGNWHFAIFNTADAFICIGAFMLLFFWVKYPQK